MWQLLLLLPALYLVICLFVWLMQERLLYFPGPPPGGTPADYGLAFREVELVAEDGTRLHAWYLEPPGGGRAAVLVCHGNAGTIGGRLELARTFLDMELGVLLFDYRGFGASEGRPNEAGTYLDAEAAYAWLVGEAGREPRELLAYGESLGGGVAIELAGRRALAGLILEGTFTSVPDVGAEVYPWLPVRLLSRNRYDNRAKIGALGIPILLVHSRDDQLIPFRHAEELQAAAGEGVELLATEGGHEDGGFLRRAQWRATVADFVERCL